MIKLEYLSIIVSTSIFIVGFGNLPLDIIDILDIPCLTSHHHDLNISALR